MNMRDWGLGIGDWMNLPPPPNPQSLSPLLIIPSLINRHYILDLDDSNSFVKYLSSNGVDTYLASWGEPHAEELEFSLDDYIVRITKMIDVVYKKTGQKIVLTGYCMGGLLSLAAAMGKSNKLQAIAFLATPWDFHARNFPRFILNKNNLASVKILLGNSGKIPAAFIQAMFYYLHANLIGHKFELYPFLNVGSYTKEEFLAVENWVNDGISMTKSVAQECFIGWVHKNNVAKLKWKTKGKIVTPIAIEHLPAFFAIPKKDNIVPPQCAFPLSEYFKNCTIIEPNAGHVGMVVGNSARTQTWEPFLQWLENI